MPMAPMLFAAVIGAAQAAGAALQVYQAMHPPKIPSISLPEIPAVPAPGAPTPDTPAAPAPPDITQPLPTVEETEGQTAQAMGLRQRRGRASTILTGPSGFYSSPNTGALKTLLGA